MPRGNGWWTDPDREQQRGAGRRLPLAALPASPRGLVAGDGDRHLGCRRLQPFADDALRGVDRVEVLEPAGERAARRGLLDGSLGRAQVPASSAGSGRASSKTLCSADAAACSWSAATMQVIRMSDVEIMSMLMPASARAPNIRAA